MEIRLLKYFLAVAREGNITSASKILHISQPTLSVQLKALENEIGKTLLIRGTKGSKKIELTEEGLILKKRAEEILELVDKTEKEIDNSGKNLSGDILIGAAESEKMAAVIKTAKKLQETHPAIKFDIFSSNRDAVMERLNKGLVDFGIIYGMADESKYNSLKLPEGDKWMVLMKNDSPLTKKSEIEPKDLWDKPLIISRNKAATLKWLGKSEAELNITAVCNLVYNSAILVREGFGYFLTLTVPTNAEGLCVRPAKNQPEAELYMVWKKNQIFSKASKKFLDEIKKELG